MEPLKVSLNLGLSGIGGAVQVKNEKGELTMQKVKTQRYVAGKRPKYANATSDDEENDASSENSDEEVSPSTSAKPVSLIISSKSEIDDSRLKRINAIESKVEGIPRRRREIAEPVFIQGESDDAEDSDDDVVQYKTPNEANQSIKRESRAQNDENSDEEEMNQEERQNRRLLLKKKILEKHEEVLGFEDNPIEQDSDDSDSDESEEEEEYSGSEDEVAPRLKPVFVRKKDRVTIHEKEQEELKEKQIELERLQLHEESKKQTKKIISEELSKERLMEKETDENIECDFETDEENNVNDYEAWKLRELKRIKRDRESREITEKDKQDTQRFRNMTDEERAAYRRANPKEVVNERVKGKYKFLQKFYHRGAFYMDEDQDVFKRNFSEPTLEDHYDKTVLPKVMQVKNFGMAGRTKYTHLLDQDTTRAEDNPWSNQEKFIDGKGGGTKQVFNKPTSKKRK